MPIYYTAPDGRCGDFISFYWDGRYHLYYLHQRGLQHLSTDDFVTFREHPLALGPGGDNDQDWMIATGSFIEKDGTFYLYYCGMNPHFARAGGLGEVVLRASSRDLDTWTRDSAFRLEPPLERYTNVAWRDPYVFWNSERGQYWMILTAQLKEGPGKALVPERRTGVGCTALYTSPDLEHWQEQAPIYSPGLFDTTECPDLFRWGDWWYLTWNEYHDIWSVHYRMALAPDGPWLAPADDYFDGRAFYAAKTVSDGRRRFLAGWLCTKAKDEDKGGYEWGGSLLVHELQQRQDGTLGCKLADEVAASYARPIAFKPQPVFGGWQIDSGTYRADAARAFAGLTLAELPEAFMVRASLEWTPGTRSLGLLLRADSALTDWYAAAIEPGRGLLKFDRWLRAWDYPWLERPLRLQGNRAELTVLVNGSEIVIYVDDSVALSGRLYDLKGGWLGLYASEGQAVFSSIRLTTS
ncbi:MAG: hypothetical protein ACYC6L_13380 [Anaerolineae bacterium]